MLSHLLLNPALILGAVAACFLARFITHFISTHRALRHVPGPRPSSLVWGDEWLLYHSTPGIHYVRWHRQYGKVLRFTSAFGVCPFIYPSFYLLLNDSLASSFVHY